MRGLAGLDFAGCDVVEVYPQYDGAGQITALLAATVAYEFLSLLAGSRKAAETDREAARQISMKLCENPRRSQ